MYYSVRLFKIHTFKTFVYIERFHLEAPYPEQLRAVELLYAALLQLAAIICFSLPVHSCIINPFKAELTYCQP